MTTETRTYVVAMIKDGKETVIKPLDTGRRYTRDEAMARAKIMNDNCQFELKYLDYDKFIAYSIYIAR